MGINFQIGEARGGRVLPRTDRVAPPYLRHNNWPNSSFLWLGNLEHAAGLKTTFARMLHNHPGAYRLQPRDLTALQRALVRFDRKKGTRFGMPGQTPSDRDDLREGLMWLIRWTQWALQHAEHPTLVTG